MDYSLFEERLGSWGPKMKSFITGPQCDEIYSFLKKRSSEGRVILPSWENTFRAFKETPIDQLKSVWFMQDPYPWKKDGKFVADGIALSCSNSRELQPSLSLFYEAMQSDLKVKPSNPDLAYLCNQGIMMLNTSLTVELNKPGSHSQVQVLDKRVRIWEPFMRHFFAVLEEFPPGLVLVFCGAESQYYKRFVYPLQHHIFEREHPAAAAHKERKWQHKKIFSTVDNLLKQNNHSVNWI